MLINYYLFSKTNKYGESAIRISVIIRKTRMMTTIGYSVRRDKWNARKQAVKTGYINHKGQSSYEINERLDEIRDRFRQYEKTVRGKPSEKQMRLVLSGNVTSFNNGGFRSMLELLDVFVKEESMANQWTKGTMDSFVSLKKHIAAHCGAEPLEYFDDDGVTAFLNYLRHDCKMMESTVRKEFKCLKWFLNWAMRKHLITSDCLFQVRPKMKILEQPVIYLTKEELMKLWRYPLTGDLGIIRDMFCFCAFTSLRYSDMIKLRDTDVIGDILYVTTKKTNDRLPINLNSFSAGIFEKYKAGAGRRDGYVFPRASNVEMNRKLKMICRMAGIDSPVTKVYVKGGERMVETKPKYCFMGTHAGRRTFICFALANGVPPQVVMKWTGHSDYAAMRPYIEIAETTKIENMLFLEKKLKE